MVTFHQSHFVIVAVAPLLLINVVSNVNCNQMDPHVWPSQGPYFEGWYMRVIDFSQGVSLGWIFSDILPKGNGQLSSASGSQCHHSQNGTFWNSKLTFVRDKQKEYPCPIMITHLLSSNRTSKLMASYDLLPHDNFTITKNGHPIVSNPDDESPAEFEVQMGQHIHFVVNPESTKFSIRVGDAIFKGETNFPIPWGPRGQGPEGWLEKFPLPIHWFVYSLRSEVKSYEYVNTKTGQIIKGGSELGNPVVAHMEKNWGGAFPKAWIWAEGVNPENNASFACSAGILHELVVDFRAELSGYKNPSKGIDCKFHPLNSIHVLEQDGCLGYVKFMAKGLECDVHFDISVDPKLLSSCLITPQVTGYKLGCVESYNAVANITVFQRHGLDMVQTDSQTIKMSALEFGGNFMCHGKCPT